MSHASNAAVALRKGYALEELNKLFAAHAGELDLEVRDSCGRFTGTPTLYEANGALLVALPEQFLLAVQSHWLERVYYPAIGQQGDKARLPCAIGVHQTRHYASDFRRIESVQDLRATAIRLAEDGADWCGLRIYNPAALHDQNIEPSLLLEGATLRFVVPEEVLLRAVDAVLASLSPDRLRRMP